MNFWSVVQGGMSQNIEEIKSCPLTSQVKQVLQVFQMSKKRMINHSLFIAYAPTEDPQIAVSVVIPGSNSEKHCRLVTSEILEYWNTLQKRITKRKVH